MVQYVLPKYIYAARVQGSAPFRWGPADSDPSAPEPRSVFCLRCVVNIAKGRECGKPAEERCESCAAGNHGGCTKIPREFNGRYERLLRLRDRYNAAVAACPDARAAATDPQVQSTGLKLARAQRALTKSLTASRLAARRGGRALDAPTQNPSTSQDFLALILAEQRGIRAAMESLASSAKKIAEGFGGDNGDNDDDDDDDMAGGDDALDG